MSGERKHFMMLAGAGEKQDRSQLAYRFLAPIIPSGSSIQFITYENSIGPVNSTPELDWGAGLLEAVDSGLHELEEAVRRTGTVPWPIGYSLGGYVVSMFLERYARGDYPDLEIGGAIEIGSPRAYTRGNREGIAGAHGKYPRIPCVEVCNYHDLICSTPKNSIMTKLPNVVSALTGDQLRGADLHRWFMEVIVEQTAPPTLEDIRMLTGYANRTFHERDYLSNPVFRQQVRRVVG